MSERDDRLRSFDVSDPVIELAAGRAVHHGLRHFEFPAREAPLADFAFPGGDPEFVPITQSDQDVLGVWQRDGRLEFIVVNMEEFPAHRVIGSSETALWYWIFIQLMETGSWQSDDEAMTELNEIAAIAGFPLLDEAIEFQSQYGGREELLNEKCRRSASV